MWYITYTEEVKGLKPRLQRSGTNLVTPKTTMESVLMGVVDKQFLVDLGQRIRARRKERGITQARLAEHLGFSQPQVQGFESGRRRIPVTLLPTVSDFLGISVEALLGIEGKRSRRGRPSKLERQFEAVIRLPRKKQQLVSEMLEAIIVQAQ
jgi:transcriptional regulator with XRE-family HTH domain